MNCLSIYSGLKSEIESDFGGTLNWSQRLNRAPERDRKRQIFSSCRGSIESPENELKEIGEWAHQNPD